MRRWEVAARFGVLLGVWAAIAGCGMQPPSTSQPASRNRPGSPGSRTAFDTLELIPADAMLGWYGRPVVEPAGAPDSPSVIQTSLDLIMHMTGRKLDPSAAVGVRLLEALGKMVQYPHAVVMVDTEALPEKLRVHRLRLAGLMKTGEDSSAFLQIIQKAVNEVTDAGTAELTLKSAHGWKYQELRDSRLPEWTRVCWGQIGDHFVITLGQDVWPAVAAAAAGEATSLATDKWVSGQRGERQHNAAIEIFIGSQRMRTRLDPFVHDKTTAFFEAWGAGEMSRAHWAMGMEDRAMYCVASFLMGDETIVRTYADAWYAKPEFLAAIPEQANYAVYRLNVKDFFNQFFGSLLATRDEHTRRTAEEKWVEAQRKFGFDAQRDVLDHLGEHIIVHNYPRHPLRLPIFFTSLIEIRSEPRRVAEAIDKLCSAWQQTLIEDMEKGIVMPATLIQQPDGAWYLGLGLAGPAWIVTDKYIVTSHSPKALREYLNLVGDKAGKPLGARMR